MCTIELFAILLIALLVLGILAFVLDSVKDKELDAPVSSSRAFRIVCGCSFLVKFGMILTACALVGSLSTAGLGLAMAFAIPKPTKVQPSSWFDHSHNVATTIPFGAIVPVDWRFMLPGEKFKQNISGFCRALMLKAPAMQDVDLKFATFFVPTRLLSDKNEEIISKVDTPAPAGTYGVLDDILYVSPTGAYPYISFGDATLNSFIIAARSFTDATTYKFDFDKYYSTLRSTPSSSSEGALHGCADFISHLSVGSLMDYMGFPVCTDSELSSIATYYRKNTSTASTTRVNIRATPISLLPFQAYHAICNHFFVPDFQRREVADSLVNIHTDWSGLKSFTSSNYYNSDLAKLLTLRYSQYESDPYTCTKTADQVSRIGIASAVTNEDGVLTDILNANTIRGMFALDEYARKIENFYGDLRKQIKFMFGIKVSDKSALSPILVDAGSCPVGVSEIQNTTLDSVDSEQSSQSLGKMTAGFGKEYSAFEVEEHGVMMSCVWIRPRTSYLNRIPPMFRFFIDQATIPNPLFAEIGNTVVNAYDVDFNPFGWLASSQDKGFDGIINRMNTTFGYSTRYVEWKYTCDSFTGDFRGPLAYWHCARDFDEKTVIVDDSSQSDPYISAGLEFNLINGEYSRNVQPLNRIFTQVSGVPNVRPFQLQLRFKTKIWQPYPHIDDEL